MKRWLIALMCVLVIPVAMLAQHPAQNVSQKKHPNLAAAQRLVEQAFNKVGLAQQANEWDMHGHAEKAKKLLDEANNELKQAALAANQK
jgi:hypothetical protein